MRVWEGKVIRINTARLGVIVRRKNLQNKGYAREAICAMIGGCEKPQGHESDLFWLVDFQSF